ncbi:DUF4124 domain-containing protein [Chitinibacter fontanus]|uniref:DUF4124 domain-containing protein n=1 Tax=Chitinibacter fontanus TaxID=1737446 RepID=A0A7D5ZBH7_9NEIS|nr:DUF4124 domain-containing protein [Chitinibacter fontanus]QLI81345.1 DUF4124 domain-containing protein [Chitinibacter fontanus]
MRDWLVLILFAASFSTAQAGLYRWVDETGKVQYSDKPPAGQTKGGVAELDKSGRVRNASSSMSEAERAALQAQKQKEIEQRRKDRALLQSFSTPEEVDILRDRQIEALGAAQQTNRLRLQTLQERLNRLNKQTERLAKSKKPIPNDLQTEIDLNRDEINSINESLARQDQELIRIKEKAEADKARLIQLRQVKP